MSNAEMIQEYRKKHGLSQKEFAEKYGLSESTVRGWEKERSNVPECVIRLMLENMALEKEIESQKQQSADLDAFIRLSSYYKTMTEGKAPEKGKTPENMALEKEIESQGQQGAEPDAFIRLSSYYKAMTEGKASEKGKRNED